MKLNKSIIIYGPPGIGKSTITLAAQKRGLRYLDLEAVPASLRAIVAKSITPGMGVVVGAANMRKTDFREGIHHVGLISTMKQYKSRRDARDNEQPNKRGQMSNANVERWFYKMRQGHYDTLINPSGKEPDDVIDEIIMADRYFMENESEGKTFETSDEVLK